MAITYYASTFTPAHGVGTQPVTRYITPPSGMTDGDLCVVSYFHNGNGGDFYFSTSGDQTWYGGGRLGHYGFFAFQWCRFNGTWSADPGATIYGTADLGYNTIQMHVFRPTLSTNYWGVDNPLTDEWIEGSSYTAPANSSTDITIAGVTTTKDNTIALATWHTEYNVYNETVNAGFTNLIQDYIWGGGTSSQAYKILTSAGSTGSPKTRQQYSVLSYGKKGMVTFYEYQRQTFDIIN